MNQQSYKLTNGRNQHICVNISIDWWQSKLFYNHYSLNVFNFNTVCFEAETVFLQENIVIC